MMEEKEKITSPKYCPEEKEKENKVKEIPQNENIEKEDINLFFKKTLKNTLSAFFLSLISTVVNFTCNIPLLRNISKESYGIVKVHFELAFTLINFIPRETIRRASQKFCPDNEPEKEKEKYIVVSQINYLFFFCTSILCIIIFFCFMLFTDSERLHQNFIQLIIYILCGLLELLIEPVIMHMNLHMENKFLPITISSISRVITNTIFVALFKMDLWGFTLSRIIGTTVYISYIFSLGFFKYKLNFFNFIPKDYKSLILERMTISGIDLLYLREILYQFIKLNLLNFILTRCQNVVLSFVIKSSDEEKSDYSFISQNYGLITRFLLEPIIDAFYNLVNKLKHIEKKVENKIKKESQDNKANIIKNKNKENKNDENISIDVNMENDNEFELKEVEQKQGGDYAHVLAQIKSPQEQQVFNFDKKNIEKVLNSLKKEEKVEKKEINYDMAIKLLQLFLKIFTYIGIFVIPYYLLIGTEILGLIYGQKWKTNNIDKIGDCYSYYVIISAFSDLIKNFGNATNDTRQMNLSYISLIINALFLSLFMYILSKWDICGLIITNVLSCAFLINCNLYIVFCGKKTIKNSNIFLKESIIIDIDNFINKCFINKNSMIITSFMILFSHIIKKLILKESVILIKISGVSLVGFFNICIIYFLEKKNFLKDLNFIKLY